MCLCPMLCYADVVSWDSVAWDFVLLIENILNRRWMDNEGSERKEKSVSAKMDMLLLLTELRVFGFLAVLYWSYVLHALDGSSAGSQHT